jgi:5'-3' exonuclease
MPGPLLAVDGPYLLYRSFFALPESIVGIEGRPIGALLGATNVLLRFAAEREPRAIVICFGAEAAEYRVELFAPYHADRPAPPEALAWQFDVAEEYFAEFGWESHSTPTFEADDVLHSLARLEEADGGRALLLTGDRDMYQCATDHVSVLFLKAGTVGGEEVGPAEVRQRYGIPPELVPDFIALRGDPSDSLPGAPGIGAKTAAELLARHGSLEGVIANAGDERPRIAAALRDNAEALRGFKEIATLRDVEVQRPEDAATDLQAGAAAARRFGMNRLAERLDNAETVQDL